MECELFHYPTSIKHISKRASFIRFRLAAYLLTELSDPPWAGEEELKKTLEKLPNNLFGVYDRFLEALSPDHLACAEATLRWIMFSTKGMTFKELADAGAFKFLDSDGAALVYEPRLRGRNVDGIPEWLAGFVIKDGSDHVVLNHSSVQDYLLSPHFEKKFGPNLNESHSHTFIARACITYLLHFSDNPLEQDALPDHPLLEYATRCWCHHLWRSHDRAVLIPVAKLLLEDGNMPPARQRPRGRTTG
jgi:hypothetical protein